MYFWSHPQTYEREIHVIKWAFNEHLFFEPISMNYMYLWLNNPTWIFWHALKYTDRQTDRRHNHLCASPLTHRQTSSSTFTVRQHYCIIRRVIRIHKAWNFQSLVTFNAQYVCLCKDLSHKSAEMQTFPPFF